MKHQTLQIDTFTGHRMTRNVTITQITIRDGIRFGRVNTCQQYDLLVRQIDRSWSMGLGKYAYCSDWIFCDEQGRRIHKEFEETNEQWRKYMQQLADGWKLDSTAAKIGL